MMKKIIVNVILVLFSEKFNWIFFFIEVICGKYYLYSFEKIILMLLKGIKYLYLIYYSLNLIVFYNSIIIY